MPDNLTGYLIFSLFIFRFLLSRVGAQKHTPHKTTRQGRVQDDGKGEIFRGRRIQHERRGHCPLAPTSFSCLDARKGCEKKIKASGMPANLAGYLIFSLFIFRFLLSRVGAY